MGVVVVLTRDEEVDSWWPEEGDEHSYSLVVDGSRKESMLAYLSVHPAVLGLGLRFAG